MDCTFHATGDGYELAFERRLNHPPAKVWRVLTERDLLRQWFPCDVVGEWKVGEGLEFVFQHGEGEGLPEEELRGQVFAVEPPRLLEFSWGQYRYRYELVPEGDGCLLRFTESLSDPSHGARDAAGWEMCFENLAAILQGAEVAGFDFGAWQAKFERFSTRFTPEMGPQQGPPENQPID